MRPASGFSYSKLNVWQFKFDMPALEEKQKLSKR